MKTLLTAGLVLLFINFLPAQTFTGKVIDKSTGTPLPGTHVSNLSKNITVAADLNGIFEIPASENDTIYLSYLGFTPLKELRSSLSREIRMEPSVSFIKEINVSSYREEHIRSDAPVAMTTLGAQTIEETKASGLEQVLNKANGVYMVDLGNEQHAMAIRQPISYKSMFLYMEDGIPVRATGNFNHNALIELNHASIKEIEIIRGPSSASYGSEAVGGAINFVTHNPTIIPMGKVQTEMGTTGYKKLSFLFSNKNLVLSGYTGIQRNGWRPHSDMTKYALSAKYVKELSKKSSLTLSLTGVDYYTDQTGGIDSMHFYRQDYYSPHTFTWRKVQAYRGRATFETRFDSSSSFTSTLYYRNTKTGQNPFYAIKSTEDPLKARGEINEDHMISYGALIRYQKEFNKKFTISTGVTAEISPLNYTANFIAVDKSADGIFYAYHPTDSLLSHYSAEISNISEFVRATWKPKKDLKISMSLRHDMLIYDFNNHLGENSFTGSQDQVAAFSKFTPGAGITYDLSKDYGVYANAGYGFAPPVITELFRGVKNPELIPATFINYEVGGWINFKKEKGIIEGCVYRMEGQNEIIQVRMPDGSYINQNAGKTLHEGIEYSVKYRLNRAFFIRSGATHSLHLYKDYIEKGKDYSGNIMASSPGTIARGEITWKPVSVNGLRLSLEIMHVSAYYTDAVNKNRYPGYTLVNFRTGYKIKSFELWANLINAGNIIYATTVESSAWATNYRPGAPRTLTAGVTWNFQKNEKK